MGELANYSIETDQVVLLAFRDGRRLRVHVSRLSRYLSPRDLEKVRAALKLRRDFIRKHMPKTALLLIAGSALALLAVTGKVVATIIQPSPPAPAPQHTAIVRSQPLPEPSVAPSLSPTPAVKGASTVATVIAPKPAVHHKATKYHLPTTPIARAVPLVTAPSPTPAASPTASPSPAPTIPPIAGNDPSVINPAGPTPTPTPIPNQGEVLGDSTGPGSP